MHAQVEFRHYNIIGNTTKVKFINLIKNFRIKLSECMSKDQVWKLLPFSILTDQKKHFPRLF